MNHGIADVPLVPPNFESKVYLMHCYYSSPNEGIPPAYSMDNGLSTG